MSATDTDHAGVTLAAPKTFYDGVIKVPGFGTPPDRCRDLKPVGFCEHGHAVLGRSSCGTRYCADHWRDWLEDAVIAIVARLAAYREYVDGAEKRCHHLVASPDQDRRWSARAVWDARTEAYEALEAAGVPGGAVITHPYRTSERGDALFETVTSEGSLDDGVGKWAFLRDVAESWEDLGRYVEAAPHFHAVAPAEDVDGEAVPDGWVVKRIRTFQPFHRWDSASYRDMAKSVYYVLTHAGTQEGRQSTTYFGALHPSTFDPAEELSAAAWDRIQREARKAVKEEPGEPEGVAGPGGSELPECPTEDCEAVVYDLPSLPEKARDTDWLASVRAQPNGRKRWQLMHGLLCWMEGRTDRPPPAARGSREAFKQWLRDQGRVQTPGSQQSGLSA